MSTNTQFSKAFTAATGAGSLLALDVRAAGSAVIQVTGTFTATLVAEGSLDGSHWMTLPAVDLSDSSTDTSFTATGFWRVNLVGFSHFRLRCSAYTSSPTAYVCTCDSPPNGVDLSSVSGGVVASQSDPTLLNATVVQPDYTLLLGTVKNAGPNWTIVRGVAGAPFTSADAQTPASVTDAPTLGQKLVIDQLIVSSDTQLSLTFKEETSGTVFFGPLYLAAGSTWVVPISQLSKVKLAVANKKLQVDASASGNIMVDASYHSEA